MRHVVVSPYNKLPSSKNTRLCHCIKKISIWSKPWSMLIISQFCISQQFVIQVIVVLSTSFEGKQTSSILEDVSPPILENRLEQFRTEDASVKNLLKFQFRT